MDLKGILGGFFRSSAIYFGLFMVYTILRIAPNAEEINSPGRWIFAIHLVIFFIIAISSLIFQFVNANELSTKLPAINFSFSYSSFTL